MKKVIIAGHGHPMRMVLEALINTFDIVGVIRYKHKSSSPDEELTTFLVLHRIIELELNEVASIRPELLLLINYNKIIDINILNGIFALNIHLGLLPKYRGNNANASSILNGELIVGYSIHMISEILDGGDVFYKFTYKINEGETYYHAKNEINNDIRKNISKTLIKILENKLIGISQLDSEFIYSCRLKPQDGIITSWHVNCDEIFNKFIIFSKPAGTGLKFIFNDVIYEISKISKIPNFANSTGISGSIVMRTLSGSIWVKTKNNAVSIDEIICSNYKVLPNSIFKIGDRL